MLKYYINVNNNSFNPILMKMKGYSTEIL